jgi:Tfp pilus assembly ATPase PilU
VETTDSVIVAEYTRFRVPADQIVADPALGAQFRDAVNKSLPERSKLDLPSLNKRLLNLRRRGQANGGLPRLERGFNGRSNHRPR